MNQEKIISFEIFETIGIGPEPTFLAIENSEEAWLNEAK